MIRDIRNNITAVIAAGGFATRVGFGPPKSLRIVAGKPLIEYTVVAAASAGIQSFIIFNNRPKYNNALNNAVEHHGLFEIINDRGVSNTFLIARQAALITRSRYILFMYGHAPRPSSHLIKLFEMVENSVVATAVQSSTQLSLVPSRYGYLEPPHIIPTSIIRETRYVDWKSFLTSRSTEPIVVKTDGPGEANLIPELNLYVNYIIHLPRFAGLNRMTEGNQLIERRQ